MISAADLPWQTRLAIFAMAGAKYPKNIEYALHKWFRPFLSRFLGLPPWQAIYAGGEDVADLIPHELLLHFRVYHIYYWMVCKVSQKILGVDEMVSGLKAAVMLKNQDSSAGFCKDAIHRVGQLF